MEDGLFFFGSFNSPHFINHNNILYCVVQKVNPHFRKNFKFFSGYNRIIELLENKSENEIQE